MSSTDQNVAVVTGARGGIGRVISDRLADAGQHVLAIDLTPVTDDDSHPNRTSVVADITNGSALESVFTEISGKGPITSVVNCAGILRDLRVENTPGQEITLMWQVNVEAMARICHLAVPHMPAGAAIVNIGSVSCRLGRWSTGASMYAATKAGVEAYSRYLACELAARKIRVNALVPGLISVPMSPAMQAVTGGEEASAHHVPMGRYGTCDEIADAVEFLLSEKASYITGTTLVVDGGVTIA